MGENLSRKFATMSEEERRRYELEMEQATATRESDEATRSWSSASHGGTTAPRRPMWRTGTTWTLRVRTRSTRGARGSAGGEDRTHDGDTRGDQPTRPVGQLAASRLGGACP